MSAARPCAAPRRRLDARVRFSFVGNDLELLSIVPLKNAPLQRTVNRLLDDIAAALPACRRIWWATKQTTCLANQWGTVPAPGVIELSPEAAANARPIAGAIYDPDQERLLVTFLDGTTLDASIRR